MRLLFYATLIIYFTGCGNKEPSDIYFYGKANIISLQEMKTYGGGPAQESSLIVHNNHVYAFTGYSASHKQHLSSLGESGREFNSFDLIATNWRFNYVMQYQGVFYNFGLLDDGIHLWSSTDMFNWVELNNGQPVLTKSNDPSSYYYHMWNSAITVDDSGVWHILAETSPNSGTPESQWLVGLSYSTGMLVSGNLDFDTNRDEGFHAIPNAGNPHLEFIQGKGLLAFHGYVKSPVFNLGYNEWYTTISTKTLGDNDFVTHNEDFAIGSPKVHICDPTIINLPSGGSMMSVSYDQKNSYMLRSELNIEEFFDLVQ